MKQWVEKKSEWYAYFYIGKTSAEICERSARQ